MFVLIHFLIHLVLSSWNYDTMHTCLEILQVCVQVSVIMQDNKLLVIDLKLLTFRLHYMHLASLHCFVLLSTDSIPSSPISLLVTTVQDVCILEFSLTCFRIPPGNVGDVYVSEIKQADDVCMDTLGHSSGERVGMYKCHKAGGNQVLGIHLTLRHLYMSQIIYYGISGICTN